MLLPPQLANHLPAQKKELRWPPPKTQSMYMHDGRNKSWGWIIASFLVGLGIGLIIMFFVGAARVDEIARLKSDTAAMVVKNKEESIALANLRTDLASANATIETLTAANSQSTSDLAIVPKAEPPEAKVAVEQATATSTKQAAPIPNKPTVEIASRSVSPTTVKANGNIVLAVKVKGHADKVRMQIEGTGGVSYKEITYLVRVSKSGGTETWRKNGKAPPKKGKYRYYAGAFFGSKKITMPGVSDWTFEVK